jgi:hypothetical protein
MILVGQVYMANNNAPLSAIAEPPTPVSPSANGKSLKYKQVSANDFPGLYDDIDIDLDKLGCIMLNTETIKVMACMSASAKIAEGLRRSWVSSSPGGGGRPSVLGRVIQGQAGRRPQSHHQP